MRPPFEELRVFSNHVSAVARTDFFEILCTEQGNGK